VKYLTIHFILYCLRLQLNFEKINTKNTLKPILSAKKLCLIYLHLPIYVIHTQYLWNLYISFCSYFFEKWIHKVEENGIWNWRYDKPALCYKSCSRDIGSICLKNRWFFGMKCQGKFKLIPHFLSFLSLFAVSHLFIYFFILRGSDKFLYRTTVAFNIAYPATKKICRIYVDVVMLDQKLYW